MATLELHLVTPERLVLTEQVDSLSCPTTMGIIEVLPGHMPLIASLQSGELVARVAGQPQYIAVSGGFVEVRPGNKVIILADSADRETEIDEQAAAEAVKRAEESMKQKHTMSQAEYATVAAEFQKNLARLKVVRRRHHGHANIPSSN